MRINAIKLAKILEGREPSPIYGMSKNTALHLFRLSGANLNFDEKDKYLAEFISEQEEIDPCILQKFFEKLVENELFLNPECEKGESKENIRKFLNQEVFVNGFGLSASNKIEQTLEKIQKDLPTTTKIINETHIYNNNNSKNNMSSQDQNINGNGNQAQQVGDNSSATQSGNFNIQMNARQFEIEDKIDEILKDKNLDNTNRKRLKTIKEDLENAKNEEEKKGVLTRLVSLLKILGDGIKGVSALKGIVEPLLKIVGIGI